jgi:type IV pilus assembly protein PilM
MNFKFLRRHRGVGLDVGTRSVKALVLEKRRSEVVVAGSGMALIEGGAEVAEFSQAVHAALAGAGADGEPVVAAVGGSDVVVRQVLFPPVPGGKILSALELQHRELGLLAPRESTMDAQVLRKSKRDATSNDVLCVSVPKGRVDERMRLLRQAGVHVRMVDVEPLALLNAALHLTGLDSGELLVLLTVIDQSSVLCLFSDQGPVVARYLDIGAEAFFEKLQTVFPDLARSPRGLLTSIPPSEAAKAQAACREIVERMAEDVRLSLTFYRTEYDRESLPRYAVGGSINLSLIGRWLGDRLGLSAPLELMDPFKVLEVEAKQTAANVPVSGPQFLGAFGLALRGL